MPESWLGFAAIAGLKLLERHIKVYRKVQFAVKWRSDGFSQDEALRLIARAALSVVHVSVKHGENKSELSCELRERALPDSHEMPDVTVQLAQRPGILELEWKT